MPATMKKRPPGKNRRLPPYVEISSIVHATEDLDKVLKAVKNILPEEYADAAEYEKSVLSGYHKNPITILKAFIRERAKAMAFLKKVLGRLEADDRALLSSEFKGCTDSKGNLYVRLDKQEAFLGKIRLGSVDPIHIKARLDLTPITFEELESILETDK